MSIVISEALEEPYFKCEVSFDQNSENSAGILSNVATQLLEKVKSDVPLTESYRIEVKFNNCEKVLEFCVSLKITAWYNIFFKGNQMQLKLLRIILQTQRNNSHPNLPKLRLVKLEAKTEIFDPLEKWYEDVMEKEISFKFITMKS
ncbi:hypothetical protein C1645_744036 [Glomus cerebriforme]|uniref:Uncharacterized protein n=1 Tax=Glomus cerebriforme TaxID=658196 RepID=A0A397SHX4_9GLOM|nr:hypothetical protein C1645_744036 [Glomus cerebriforme]